MKLPEFVINIVKPILRPVYRAFKRLETNNRHKREYKLLVNQLESSKGTPRIIYLGVCRHTNLGDMAQYYCIQNWIKRNYPECLAIEVDASVVVNPKFEVPSLLKQYYNRENDIILFQSGYTTQDLGGCHDEMHRVIISEIPEARILMMPQTVFFLHKENRDRSAKIYNMGTGMLFLARDLVSYSMACDMMPDVTVLPFPDIVTTLIGRYNFSDTERQGVCMCRRDDGEKLYPEEELRALCRRIEEKEPVMVNDTTLKMKFAELVAHKQQYIEKQISEFAKFKVVVTDRYHGTIFALAAGTPVVILKTTDHKVITGADWFKGVYDSHVHVADNLDEAYDIVCQLIQNPPTYALPEYFGSNYYDTLKAEFEKI